MKRKALVISSYPAPYRVAVFQELAKSYDMDIFFTTCQNENRNAAWFCTSDALSFHILNDDDEKNKFDQALKTIKQYDFVLAYDPTTRAAMRAILKSQRAHVPYFVNNDGAFVRKGNPMKAFIKRVMFRKAALCFASGKSAADYFISYGVPNENIRYHNFTSLTAEDILSESVSVEERESIRSALGLRQGKVYVITVGQFIYRKGFDLLLEAWVQIKDSANAQLLIVGGGDEKPAYEQFVKDHNLLNVTIVDFLNKNELFQYYKACDIFVLPTREDIWGLVINEAMACGLPVISSDMCIAARELVVHGENGFIYPVNDTCLLAKHLDELVFDASLRCRIADNNIKAIQGNTMQNIAIQHLKDIEEYFKARE